MWVEDDYGLHEKSEQKTPEVEKPLSSGIPLERLVIPFGGYSTIVADPPWKYGKWGKAIVPNYAGHKAAYKLSHRLMVTDKIKTELLFPEKPGTDFLDEHLMFKKKQA